MMRKQHLALITLALTACVSTTVAQTLLFKDDFSDPKLSGWIQLGVPGVLSNLNQQVLISANCGPLQTNNPILTHAAFGHAILTPTTLTNNWTLEERVDLVGANQDDVWGSAHFLWNNRGGAGYVFWKDQDEVALNKFWNGTSSMAWFFYEQGQIKNQNVTLVLSLTRRDANLVINTRVLDKDNANAVLFDRTVTDTPQADPVLPNRSVKGVPGVNDETGEAWRLVSGPGYVEVTLDWTNPERAPTGAAQIIYDNVEVRLYESPRPNVVAWGQNDNGETDVPPGLTNVVAVAAGGGASLALRSDGTLAAWGTRLAYLPDGLSNLVTVAACWAYGVLDNALALRADETVVGWWHGAGQTNAPAGLTNVVAVAPGSFHSLALRADGTVVAWGDNSAGQTSVPSGLTNAVAVAAGSSHSLALRADGSVIAWGDNGGGQTNVPSGLSNVVAMAAGSGYSLAVRADGTVVAWGRGGFGGASVPIGLTNVVAVAADEYQSLALRADGTVVAWPPESYGAEIPSGLTNVVAIAAGGAHSLALVGDGPPAVQAPLSHPTASAHGFSVSLPTQSGRVYALEYKDSLTDAAWTALPLVAGTGHERTLTDPTPTGAQRFYRVRRW